MDGNKPQGLGLSPNTAKQPNKKTGAYRPSENASKPQDSSTAGGQGDRRGVKKLVLCFDGTGNKFHGDDSDSNILKIFRMLDRTADDQYHYYQRKRTGTENESLSVLTRLLQLVSALTLCLAL
jgi:uncharacterized protein (DUF2235 family)